MNRREVITGAAGLALTSFVASPNSRQFAKGAERDRDVNVCPIFMCMNQGSYATYYAMETQSSGKAPCLNPRMMIGPVGLTPLGCASSSCVTRSVRDSRQKGDDAVFHTKDDLAKNGCADHATAFAAKSGVVLSREGVYEITVKKGGSVDNSTFKVRLREIVVIPSKCTDAPAGFEKNPAVIIYDAVELADPATPLNLMFGDLELPDKKDGHHFKLKVKSDGDKLIFTLLCKK